MDDAPEIWDDPNCHIDWSRRHAFMVNDAQGSPDVLQSDESVPIEVRKFQAFRIAAVRAYNAHIAKGGTDANWPGIFLSPPPAVRRIEQPPDDFLDPVS